MMTSMQGTDVYASGTKRDPTNNGTFSKEAGGAIKAYNNHMEGSYTFIPYGASKYVLKGAETAIGDIDSKVDFDAYVVSSRDAQVPSSVKSYSGENTYNNFDTDKSIMYSYTADSPEQAVANVRAYAGRLQGGDFKWTFDNSVDDASSDVNQKLKDALMAYKGSNGEVVEYPSSSSIAQSSSSEAPKSSSSVIPESVSSSSEQPQSSSSSSSEKVESSSSEGTMGFAKVMPTVSREIYYDARSASLVIGAADITRLDIVGVDGRRVNIADIKSVGDARVLDMSSLRAGVYIVRFLTPLGLQTMKFVKN
jgi:pectate lyase